MPKGHYERKGQYPAKTYKDTFWSKKRIDNNILIKDLAEMFGVSRSSMGAYFTGYLVPPEPLIDTLCEYFGVDKIEGTREFIKAHKEYDAECNERTLKASAKKPKERKEEKPTTQAKPVVEVEQPIEEKKGMTDTEKIETVKKLAYGKVSYDDFSGMDSLSVDKVEETVYGKVDYVTFKTVERILEGSISQVESYNKWSI